MKGRLRFDDPLTRLKGVGPRRAERLAALGLRTIADLLRRAPRAYEDRGALRPVGDCAALEAGSFAVVRGRVARRALHRFRGRATLRAKLEDETGTIDVLWFHAGHLADLVTLGSVLAVSGRLSEKRAILHPEIAVLPDLDAPVPPRLLGLRPIYPLGEGVPQRFCRELAQAAIEALDAISDPLPADIRERAQVLPIDRAIDAAHAPTSLAQASRGQERLLFDEIVEVELALARRAAERGRVRAPRAAAGGGGLRFLRALPFSATRSQIAATEDLAADFEAQAPLERLVAGEVGSGKTVVALAACEEARSRGLQSALLAPTALLAQQHARTARELLAESGASVALLTGSLAADEAMRVREGLARGTISLAIGTHALLSEATRFHRLGLAVIDEQHRFGVEQRASIAMKGRGVRVLGMSATPIPRTLALLAVPGWEVSFLEGRPGSRGDVATRVVPERKRGDALRWIAKQIAAGEQALFVRPRIEGEEDGAVALADELRSGALSDCRLGLVHGAMKEAARALVLERFSCGELSALVATTVVEVGIDVPGAGLLWIEGAERFGLAQIHQLRGRIARRGQKGYCFLVASPRATDAARERLSIVCEVADGLRLAEIDLAERGPGELLGVKQSGALGIGTARGIAGDPRALARLVARARDAARELALREGTSRRKDRRCAPEHSLSR